MMFCRACRNFLIKALRSTIWTRANRLSEILDQVQSANVYLGAKPLVEALDKGARIIVGGRLDRHGFDARTFDARIRLVI